jgi:hypothetical protein
MSARDVTAPDAEGSGAINAADVVPGARVRIAAALGERLTRRAFVAQAGVAGAFVAVAPALQFVGGATIAMPAASGTAASTANVEPVVSFHMDMPYLDFSGQGVPYIPPAGMRSGQALAEMSDADFCACTYGA